MIEAKPRVSAELSSNISLEVSQHNTGNIILERLHLLQDDFLKNGGSNRRLVRELNQLYTTNTDLSLDTLAFVDEWVVDICPVLDLHATQQYRNLFYHLFHQFEHDPVLEQIGQRFHLSKEELIATTPSKNILDWMILWAIYTYPSLSLFVFGKTLIRVFERLKFVLLPRIIQHLPAFLLWNIRTYLHQTRSRKLVMELANGKNIRKAKNRPFPFNRRMAHLFSNSPIDTSYEAAIWRALVVGWGGDTWLAQQLHHYFGRETREVGFLKLLIFFFRKTEEQIAAEEMKQLLGYLQHRWDEEENFHLKGWTLASLRRKSQQWYEALQQEEIDQYLSSRNLAPKWTGASYNSFALEQNDSYYEIIQLNSIKKLQEEGRRLMHCVGNYAAQCQLYGHSIWSLRQTTGKRHRSLVTIEVSKDHRIIQARKMFNANPDKDEWQLIRAWAEREGLAV